MLKIEDIVEEIVVRIAQLEHFAEDYKKQGNQHGFENANNRAQELKRLKQFIDDRWSYGQQETE
jgi:hypothetical protein